MPLPCEAPTKANPDSLLDAIRPDDGPALYEHTYSEHLRDRFLWFDWQGNDLLEPHLRALVAKDPSYRFSEDGKRFDRAEQFNPPALPILPEPSDDDLSDDDFRVLNALETEEARRINFGAFETAITSTWLATALNRSVDDVRSALVRLSQHHYLLWVEDSAVRSRMSELAREVRYVRQRFGPDDADSRPYMIRAVQVRSLPRTKPVRNQPLTPCFEQLKKQLQKVPQASQTLDALHAMLKQEWGSPVNVAGFQLRSLESLLPAYLGVINEDAFVITADTGSGKTEAALLPLIAGAAIDRHAGRRGTKAVLVYPRVRLAYNQAQRLVKYLTLLAAQPGGAKLTVGLQSKDVPLYSHKPATYQPDGSLENWAGDSTNGFEFPLFGCPACGKPLKMRPGGGTDGHDRLTCSGCTWTFDGWAGSKVRVQNQPPDFFLPVAESLSQWQHDPDAGSLFGDKPDFLPPRALLADEIHLYSHIQGAQIGYTLRRLLARCALNARANDVRPSRPLAVGMSATLGQPSAVWGQLANRSNVPEIAPRRTPGPNGESCELIENPRAREHFYFVQPEVESRGHVVAGAAATIQVLMCLSHGMRRRSGDRGGYRGLVFFDSIDNLKQLHHDYTSAEQQNRLAALRTCRFPTEPATKRPRRFCCGKPAECDTFRAGECWYFAAAEPGNNHARPNDPHQVVAGPQGDPAGYAPGRSLTVMDRPVYSGTSGKVEESMGRADLVFSTSSLEVGFDDPDMILVYQHYAPGNLASFAQRKGRGGRGTDDRPVTGCTLSIYSPKDNWYFRHPDLLLEGSGFDVPLNPDNFFVRRGQAVATLLDAVARVCTQAGGRMPDPKVENLPAVAELLKRADARLLQLALGDNIFTELKVKNLTDLWRVICENVDTKVPDTKSWRHLLPWVPLRLFDAINLPQLRVTYPRDSGQEHTEPFDVSLAFGYCSPGNATRRFGHALVHWVPPPITQHAPMFTPTTAGMLDAELVEAGVRQQIGNTAEALDKYIRDGLPDEVIGRLAPGQLYHHLFRPEWVRLGELGRFTRDPQTRRVNWQSRYYWLPTERRLVHVANGANPPDGAKPVHHKTGSELLNFPLITETTPGKKYPVRGLSRLTLDLVGFIGGAHGKTDTGLRVHRTYWGADVSLRLGDRGEEEENWTVAFTDAQGDQPALYGYRIDTEGVRLTPDAKSLTAFVEAEVERISKNDARTRWHRGQLFRFRLASLLAGRGLNFSIAGPVAELLIAANGDEQLATRLTQLRKKFDPDAFLKLLAESRMLRLEYHPLLTADRVSQLADHIGSPEFGKLFTDSLAALRDDAAFKGYIRSLVLHGLLLALHGAFVVHGRGEPRQVCAHAKLPIQFGPRADDNLTVFETGDHGDGTTRTFLRNVGHATAEWRRGELAVCPHAAEQALLDHFFERPDRHDHWRKLNPKHPDTLCRVARELTGTNAVSELHLQALGRLLHQFETVGPHRFSRYELHCEVRAARTTLAGQPGATPRRPAAWEVVSEAVRRAVATDHRAPQLAALLGAYRAIAPGQLDSLRPEARLADQVYRLGVAVCVDGCRACLHQSSPLMAEELTPSAVSREVLQNYREYLLEPGTIEVDTTTPLSTAQVQGIIARDGYCRLSVAPAVNDALASHFEQMGFSPGEYDPLLRRVVWLREG
ncbi:MAG: DEAD/DEAH box helicase [Gemmataceae bacterium]